MYSTLVFIGSSEVLYVDKALAIRRECQHVMVFLHKISLIKYLSFYDMVITFYSLLFFIYLYSLYE